MLKDNILTTSYIGETVHTYKLECGLSVHIMPKKYFAKKYAFFATQYGGIYTDYTLGESKFHMPQGTAHFLEHQIFEDNEKSSFERFEALGANLNAYTSTTSTVYHFDSIDNFDQGLKLLVDLVQNTDVSEASVSKEIEVIDQEIRMYMDEPAWELSNNLYRGLYHEHPIRSEIAGTIESIREITKDKILQCYDHFYAPNNMHMFLYGDIDVERTIDGLEMLFSDQYKKNTNQPKLILPNEPEGICYKRKDIVKDIGKGMMLVGFKGNYAHFSENKEDKLAALKIANDLMFGRSSRFFMQSIESGLITDGFDFDTQVGEGYAMSLVGNETDHIDALYEGILKEIETHIQKGFDSDDFVRMKRKILGRTVASFNSLQSIAGNYTQSIMKGNDLFKQMEAYKNLTLDSVHEAIQTFYKLENHTLSSVQKSNK